MTKTPELEKPAPVFPVERPVGQDYQATAMRYVRWHAAAYGAPAPTSEIAAELRVPVSKARVLLRRMETDGRLVSQPDRYPSGGWHEPWPNA